MLNDWLESVGKSKIDVISKLFIYSKEEKKRIILDVGFLAMNAEYPIKISLKNCN